MKEIDPHRPVNRLAGQVVGNSNAQPVLPKETNHIVSQFTPMPTKKYHGNQLYDLTGLKADRFFILGLFKDQVKIKGKSYLWVVRCSCGRYELRRSSSLKKRINGGHLGVPPVKHELCCYACQKTRYLKNI